MKESNTPIYRIYSRKRLTFKNHNYSINKKTIILTIICSFIIIFIFLQKSINPVFDAICRDEAKVIATLITNEETTKIMNKYNYDTFFSIEKNLDGNIQMISANVLKINQITSDIALNIQKQLRQDSDKKIEIATGSLTGIRMLAGSGPKISVKIFAVGNIETDLKSEFISEGVNQTIHRVYLDVICNVNILTPFSTLKESIENQVLILENLIVGEIPSSYYNFNGMTDERQMLDIVE